jgi:hypothetical protein
MPILSAFSPILRRSGAIPSWTCRACMRSRVPSAQRSTFANSLQNGRTFATKSSIPHAGKTTIGGASKPLANAAPKAKSRSKRRRRMIVTGGVFTIGAAAVTISDDAKHAKTAVQRSYRVLSTLALNVKEYVVPAPSGDADAKAEFLVTERFSNATPIQTTSSS